MISNVSIVVDNIFIKYNITFPKHEIQKALKILKDNEDVQNLYYTIKSKELSFEKFNFKYKKVMQLSFVVSVVFVALPLILGAINYSQNPKGLLLKNFINTSLLPDLLFIWAPFSFIFARYFYKK